MPSPHPCATPASSPTWPGSARRADGGHDPAVRPPSVGEWLEEWLAAKKKLRPGTVRSYASHVRLYYQPHIGHVSIDRLRVSDVASVFEAIEELNEAIASGDPARQAAVKGRRLVGPATCQRIRATLRSAISSYIKQHQGVLPANVASLIELPRGDRPKPLVWTDERVRAWQKTDGKRLADARERANGGRVSPLDIWISTPRPSPVMVWTPAQTQVFLSRAARHRLHALWRLIATRGLRRGEGCGLRRPDTDLAAAITTICWQITQLGWDTAQGPPNPTPASGRSPSTPPPSPTSAPGAPSRTGNGRTPARRGPIPGSSSPTPTAPRCTPPPSPTPSS